MRHPAAFLPLLCLTLGTGSNGAAAPLDAIRCEARLDAAVERARGGDERGAETDLLALAERCEHFPQIHHDLGVLAARDDRLPEALARFERALAIDPRAAMSLGHLRELHRREAAIAYARALGTPANAPRPRLALQDSRDVGADTLRERSGRADALRRPATVEYELYAWWRSAREDEASRRAHYVEGFPAAEALAGRARDAAIPWDEVRREIAFTAGDAVAVLVQPGPDGAETRRVLLLRLDGERWKIHREMSP